MFDELERLRASETLFTLLSHYAELAADDRERWHDRRMKLEGCERRELVRLHGELLAYGWLEQNTGQLTRFEPGSVAGCYRVTTAGIRACKQARSEE